MERTAFVFAPVRFILPCRATVRRGLRPAALSPAAQQPSVAPGEPANRRPCCVRCSVYFTRAQAVLGHSAGGRARTVARRIQAERAHTALARRATPLRLEYTVIAQGQPHHRWRPCDRFASKAPAMLSPETMRPYSRRRTRCRRLSSPRSLVERYSAFLRQDVSLANTKKSGPSCPPYGMAWPPAMAASSSPPSRRYLSFRNHTTLAADERPHQPRVPTAGTRPPWVAQIPPARVPAAAAAARQVRPRRPATFLGGRHYTLSFPPPHAARAANRRAAQRGPRRRLMLISPVSPAFISLAVAGILARRFRPSAGLRRR
ncbi:hypothetical protein PsYK624_157700 [Phanerochaete sordida]|uniref:Uncharacterized protein n=1 Tax=Phanerochaete sordida TaxID=48140 RepID=A0A9P3LLG1_9APHY|nr:hypothetical protein PsYK624_157700 [Phanerochaete sordida]